MNKDNNDREVEEQRFETIHSEFEQVLKNVKKFNPSVTFYGSTKIIEGDKYYEKVRNLAYRISKELGYAIISGGGPGIMEAANHGAKEAGGVSVGLTIKLPDEQDTNKYVTNEIPFHYFFTRQTALSYSTEVCIFCPGGFGTLNEFFEILTLQQTQKIGRIPVILFGSEYWNSIDKMIKTTLFEKYKTISEKDIELYTITDDEDKILDIVKNSKMRNGEDSLA